MDANNFDRRIVFLCSGGGGNLAFVQSAIERNWLKGAKIAGVFTDRLCPASGFAERTGLYNRVIEINDKIQEQLYSELNALNPDIIITTVHKIIGYDIINQYSNQLVNLHYSLLPSFSNLIGSKPLEAALKHQVLIAGVTVHFVDEQVDAGRPIVQGAIALNANDTIENLMPVVFRCGCIAMLRALYSLLSNSTFFSSSPTSLHVLGRLCLFSGGETVPEEFVSDEEYWMELQESLFFGKK